MKHLLSGGKYYNLRIDEPVQFNYWKPIFREYPIESCKVNFQGPTWARGPDYYTC